MKPTATLNKAALNKKKRKTLGTFQFAKIASQLFYCINVADLNTVVKKYKYLKIRKEGCLSDEQ